MKTAISIPDDVFKDADALAHRLKKSRSEIYARAVREYVARYSPDSVTEALDQALPEDVRPDGFTQVAARRALRRSEW